MATYQTISLEKDYRGVARITLNRPDVRNAFNDTMIAELTDAVSLVDTDDGVRVLVICGAGKTFCAGADLNWMKSVATYTYEENYDDSTRLGNLFRTVYHCSKPTLALIHGAAMGGANGLIAACDFAYATPATKFAFSEVKLGIAPATIAPFVIKKTGEQHARELMLTGRQFNGHEAAAFGLLNGVVETDETVEEAVNGLEKKGEEIITLLLGSAPKAVSETKKLIDRVAHSPLTEALFDDTVRLIARLRKEEEGQEGMNAFLEKRKPNWVPDN
jgi:methylglutaconyl-CoA hydratase